MIAAPAITAMRYRFSPPQFYFVIALLPWLALLGGLASVSWFLTDDAFISFRYARNLLEGHGLVFNVGERVEGYSNFLWTLELAAIWGVFGIRPEHAAPWLSVAFTVGTLAVLLWWALRTPALAYRRLTAWMALGLVCSSATFAVWTSGGGLETRQFTFFIVLAVVSLALYRRNRWGLLTASLSLAAAALTRPEGPLIAAICVAWYAVQSMADAGRLRPDWRSMAYLIAPCAIIIAAHFLFRYAYYGEWLPNTYYAKFVRPWYEMGFRYLGAAALATGLYLLLPLAWVGLRQRWRECRDGTFALVLLLLGVHAFYVLRIGGDNFEYRPLDFYWPLLALPAATGMVQLGRWIASIKIRTFVWRRVISSTPAGALLIFAPVLFYANTMQSAQLLEGAKVGEPTGFINLKLDAENNNWLWRASGMSALATTFKSLRASTERQWVGSRFAAFSYGADRMTGEYQPYENINWALIPDDAVTSRTNIGIAPYYLANLPVIDEHGLTDAVIARNPVVKPNPERIMAHDRQAPPGYLEERGVNIKVRMAAHTPADAIDRAAYAIQAGPDFWMPFNSDDTQWVFQHFAANDTFLINSAKMGDPSALPSLLHPIVRSTYDIYYVNGTLIYYKADCQTPDAAANFFLHLTPVDPADLPAARQQSGYDNRDFTLADLEMPRAGICTRTVLLPPYPIAAVKTGQYNDQGRLWEVAFPLPPP